MIQIYGAGMAGTFFYHFLKKNGIEASIFDVRKEPDCRCAWGIALSEAKELYSMIDVKFEDYVLSKPKEIVANGKIFRNKNIATFDKFLLLKDLWDEIEFSKSDAELQVDATGRRTILPPIEKDRVVETYQTLEKHEKEEKIYIYASNSGYAWAFPLKGYWHIGVGSFSRKNRELIDKLRKFYNFPEKKPLCNCKGNIRMLPPSKCRPFVSGKIVGVGEAIGCVSGAGEGNIPALRSALILYECLEKLESYEKRILKELAWIEREQKFIESLLKKMPAIHLLPSIVKFESKRMVEHSLIDALKLCVSAFLTRKQQLRF